MNNREKLKITAIRHFSERGYEGTNTRAIAADAGLAVGTLFKHFGTKEALLSELIADGFKEILDSVKKSSDGSLDELLKSLELQMQQPFWRMFVIVRHQENVKQLLNGRSASFYESLVELIRDRLKKENAKEPRSTAWFILAIMEGLNTLGDLNPNLKAEKILKKAGL